MKTIVLEDKMPSNYVHWLSGDVHVGSSAVSKQSISNLISKVKSVKNGYVSFGGDQLESIVVDDKRFNLEDHPGHAARIDAQRDMFIGTFNIIADKFLWIMDGNHERRWKNVFAPNKDIAKEFNCEYSSGIVKAIFSKFRIMDWHGNGSVNSKAGDALQRSTNEMIAVKRKLRVLPADDCEVVCMHHIHKLVIHPPMKILHLVTDSASSKLIQSYTQSSRIYIDEDRNLYRIPEEEKWYVSSGSFLRGYLEDVTTYIEEAGYAAAELGCIKVTVKNDKLYKVEKEYLR
jgi:hypothetical protein